MSEIYYVMICAVDEEGPFFQNFYPNASNEEDAIRKVSDYLSKYNYKDICIESINMFNNILGVEDLIQVEEFDGFIQNSKYGY